MSNTIKDRPRTRSRRFFLRGLTGSALALPFLGSLLRSSDVQADDSAPRYFMVGFAGMSLGTDRDYYVPDNTGSGYDLKTGLAPIGELGVQDEVGIVSGLTIPWMTAGVVPTAGRNHKWHPEQLVPLLTGFAGGADDSGSNLSWRGPTAEQAVGDAIGDGAVFRTLNYRAQAAHYRYNNPTGGHVQARMSYRVGDDGEIQPIDPTFSPRQGFDALFASFGSNDADEEARRRYELMRRRSVLDLVGQTQRERLLRSLGRTDRQRVERHFDEVRDLEVRIGAMAPDTTAACGMLADFGEDPPIAGVSQTGEGDEVAYDPAQGYSDEDRRASLMTDLIHMAFTCDLSRSASLMYTQEQCYMMARSITGYEMDVHELSHSNGPETKARRMSEMLAWHTKHFARLVQKLRDTPDGRGGAMLDHCALMMMNEGGRGYDPGTGSTGIAHSTENMAILFAGGAGGLRAGRHIVAEEGTNHPVNVTASLMQAVGVPGGLGDVTESIDALFE